MCREPNWLKGVDCHSSIQNWPEAKQLALLYIVRPSDFDLMAYCNMVNERAPNRITFDEVSVFISQIRGEGMSKKVTWNVNGPVTAEWLRSLGLDAFKSNGKYPTNTADLLIESRTGLRKDEFWVLKFERNSKTDEWFVSLSAHQGKQYLTSFWLASVTTREEVYRVFKSLGLPPEPPNE